MTTYLLDDNQRCGPFKVLYRQEDLFTDPEIDVELIDPEGVPPGWLNCLQAWALSEVAIAWVKDKAERLADRARQDAADARDDAEYHRRVEVARG